MNLFHIIEDGIVHLRSRGVYRESKVYQRGTDVFAKHGGGYVRLLGRNTTTVSNLSWDAIEAPGVTFKDSANVPIFKAGE